MHDLTHECITVKQRVEEPARIAAEDHGFMYGGAFEDPAGHIREVFWIDPAAVPAD